MTTLKGSRMELLSTLSELVGFKTGLALSRWEIADHLEGYDDLLWGLDDEEVTVPALRFERLAVELMSRLGAIPSDAREAPGEALRLLYEGDNDRLDTAQRLDALFKQFVREGMGNASPDNPLESFAELARRELGPNVEPVLQEYCGRVVTFVHASPWSSFRRLEYSNGLGLHELFESESIQTPHGHFLDQRFVDYLAQNPSALDRINWRKFEGLTGEFFARTGHHVELGSGRNDGGIDARVWPGVDDADGPPAMLVQCKRERRSIGKVVVKALWADVAAEAARSGLIVTTSTLSPGAKSVCTARAYPIAAAERPTLLSWLQAMRTPLKGVFLGE